MRSGMTVPISRSIEPPPRLSDVLGFMAKKRKWTMLRGRCRIGMQINTRLWIEHMNMHGWSARSGIISECPGQGPTRAPRRPAASRLCRTASMQINRTPSNYKSVVNTKDQRIPVLRYGITLRYTSDIISICYYPFVLAWSSTQQHHINNVLLSLC